MGDVAAASARTRGISQRQAAVETRNAAAIVIVTAQFNGWVINDLQQWGFEVVAR